MHLIKLSVGTQSVESLTEWHKKPRAQGADGLPRHITRMWPKRRDEVLGGGSIFWVIQGHIRCRQRILRFDEVIGEDGIRRCAFVLEPQLVRTTIVKRRPFQGWRYLAPGDAPADLAGARPSEEALPSGLSAALADIGVL
jgi:hypothetical protein